MSKKDNLVKFGTRLKELRVEKDFTQAKLAEKIGLSTNFIGMVERGLRNTTVDKLFLLSDALDIPLAKFFEKM